MLSEQALGQRPIIGWLMQCFKSAMHHIAAGTDPFLMRWPVRGLQGIIFLPGAASVPDVEVVECR